jgi:hypothetical protein
MILAADVDISMDRSALFFSATHYAFQGGLTVDEVEAIARDHPRGCSGKYWYRIREEIIRCYTKLAREGGRHG